MGTYIKVPISEVMTPKNGFICMLDQWWVTDGDCVLGYKLYGSDRPSPQCSTSKAAVETVLSKGRSEVVKFIHLAYWWPHKD